MKQEQFDVILSDRLNRIKTVLGNKAKEYAVGGDRLHNFKVAARINNCTPAEALWGMAMKHLVCIEDLIQDRVKATDGLIDEKIGDMINYLILLEALLQETIDRR